MDYGVFPILTSVDYPIILQNQDSGCGFTTQTLLMTATSYRFTMSLGEFVQNPNRVAPSFAIEDNCKVKKTVMGQPKSSGLCQCVDIEINGSTPIRCGLNQKFLLEDGTEKKAQELRVGDLLQGISPTGITWFNTITADLASRTKYRYQVSAVTFPKGMEQLYSLSTTMLDHFVLQCGVFVKSAPR